jgi:Ser/Thr protein kinase RdoA (MazF antagonist)
MSTSQHFPIARSVLSAEALASLLESSFTMRVKQCQLIKAMILDTYRVTTSNNVFILRVYPHQRRSLAKINAELDFLVYLHHAGMPVSVPFQRSNGEYVLAIPAPEGPRYGVLFSYAYGRPLSQNPDPVLGRAFGRTVAQIHAVADTYPHSLTRPPIDLEMLLERPLQDLERVFADHRDDWAFLRQVGDTVRPQIEMLPTEKPSYGLCHGDAGAANVHINDDGQLTVFDFDFCGAGWRAYDLATFITGEPDDLAQAFLAGYQEVRALEEDEQRTIPLFQILQSIWVLGVRADYVNEWGNMYFPDRLVNGVLSFIRDTVEQMEQ